MKEKILNAFEALGFHLDQIDDFGYAFQYEGINFLWMPDDDDENFLDIAIPAILEKENIDDNEFYELMNMMNSRMKYVKANTLCDSLWLFYERDVYDENENIERTISRMIMHLESAHMVFQKAIQEANKDYEVDTSDDLPVIDGEIVENEVE